METVSSFADDELQETESESTEGSANSTFETGSSITVTMNPHQKAVVEYREPMGSWGLLKMEKAISKTI